MAKGRRNRCSGKALHVVPTFAHPTQADGRLAAQERGAHLRDIATNARLDVQNEHDRRAARGEEEMRRMLEVMAIRQSTEEEETARRFVERNRQLWVVSDASSCRMT